MAKKKQQPKTQKPIPLKSIKMNLSGCLCMCWGRGEHVVGQVCAAQLSSSRNIQDEGALMASNGNDWSAMLEIYAHAACVHAQSKKKAPTMRCGVVGFFLWGGSDEQTALHQLPQSP